MSIQFRNGTRRGNLPSDGTDCKLMIMSSSSISVKTVDSEVTGIASFTALSGFGTTAISVTSDIVSTASLAAAELGVGGVTWTSGTGTPEGVVSAPVGSMYSRTDGGAVLHSTLKSRGRVTPDG